MKKRMMVLLMGVLVFATVAGCVSTDGSARSSSVVTIRTKDISFKSERGNLTIQNNTSADLVIFAGNVEKNAVLGGIYAGRAREFDLSKLPGIPQNGSLLVRAATYKKYKDKHAIITENDVIYTGLVVYDLKDRGDRSQLNIYRGVDTEQQTCIYVSNESDFYVMELQIGDPGQGEVIATLRPGQLNKRVYLSKKDDGLSYDFYPRFVFVNPKTGEKTSMTPSKKDRRRAVPDVVGGDLTPLRFQGPSSSNIGYDVAFLNLQNDTSTGIEFRNAETVLKNQKGNRFTHSGRSDVYEIPASNGEAGQLYTALTFEFDNFTKKTISSYKFKAGYKYDVIVTQINGNYQYDIREVGQKSLVEDAKIQLFME